MLAALRQRAVCSWGAGACAGGALGGGARQTGTGSGIGIGRCRRLLPWDSSCLGTKRAGAAPACGERERVGGMLRAAGCKLRSAVRLGKRSSDVGVRPEARGRGRMRLRKPAVSSPSGADSLSTYATHSARRPRNWDRPFCRADHDHAPSPPAARHRLPGDLMRPRPCCRSWLTCWPLLLLYPSPRLSTRAPMPLHLAHVIPAPESPCCCRCRCRCRSPTTGAATFAALAAVVSRAQPWFVAALQHWTWWHGQHPAPANACCVTWRRGNETKALGRYWNMHGRLCTCCATPTIYSCGPSSCSPSQPLPLLIAMPAPPNAAYADAKRLLPLSLLPYR